MMIEQDIAEAGTRALGAAIWQLLHDAKANASDFPRNGFQQRMRFAGLTEVGHDLSALALAAVVLLRRSTLDRERV
jgi:hypothetical protein